MRYATFPRPEWASVRHTLPPLPYGYWALEPSIDAWTLMLHHDKHHGSCVGSLNAALHDFRGSATRTWTHHGRNNHDKEITGATDAAWHAGYVERDHRLQHRSRRRQGRRTQRRGDPRY